jgi:ABC-type nitrate/sulfonate/bicarbonate transport system permease component
MWTSALPFLRMVASLGSVLAVWAMATGSGVINTDLFPSPRMVAIAAYDLYQDGLLFSDLLVSMRRAGTGFILGSTLGVLLGLFTARIAPVGYALHPFLNLLRPIPAIALVPIAIVWFGIGEGSKYFVISYTVFLSVWLATDHGASQVATTYIRASRSLGAGTWREFFEVVVPAAAPHIVAGLRLGAALAFLSLVAAELSGASAGIGYRIQEARNFIRTDRMFVGLIELGILGALLDYVFQKIAKRLVHWETA